MTCIAFNRKLIDIYKKYILYHSHIIRESKEVRAIQKPINGDMGYVMSRLNLDYITLPKIIVYGPFNLCYSMKFLIEAVSTLPLKFSIYPPIC